MNIRYPAVCAILLILPCIAFQGCSEPETAGQAITRLINSLDNPDPKIRLDRMYELGEWLSEPANRSETDKSKSKVINVLQKHLNDNDVRVRWEVATVVMQIDIINSEKLVLPRLLKDLEDPKAETREFIASRVSYFGRKYESDTITTVLIKRLYDENPKVRYAATVGLGEIDPVRFKALIIPRLLEILDLNATNYYQYDAAEICGELGPTAKEAVPALIKLMRMEKPSEYIKAACKDALKKIGTPEALAAIQPVEEAEKKRLLHITIVNCVITICFVLLFAWSVRLRKKGKKVFHWFIPVPAIIYFAISAENLHGEPMDPVLNEKFFLLVASIGCLPWLISRWIVRRRKFLESTIALNGEQRDADLWLRAGAFILDTFCVGMAGLALLTWFHIKGDWNYIQEHILMLALLIFAASVVYHAITAVVWGGGTGKRTAGIRIVPVDGREINYKQAFTRAFTRWLSALPLFAGYWPAVFSKGNTWHDRLAGTRVVYDEPRQHPKTV